MSGGDGNCSVVHLSLAQTCRRKHSSALFTAQSLADQVHVGVVVDVLSAGHLDEGVGQADELRIGVQIVGGCHGDKSDELLRAELGERPPEGLKEWPKNDGLLEKAPSHHDCWPLSLSHTNTHICIYMYVCMYM